MSTLPQPTCICFIGLFDCLYKHFQPWDLSTLVLTWLSHSCEQSSNGVCSFITKGWIPQSSSIHLTCNFNISSLVSINTIFWCCMTLSLQPTFSTISMIDFAKLQQRIMCKLKLSRAQKHSRLALSQHTMLCVFTSLESQLYETHIECLQTKTIIWSKEKQCLVLAALSSNSFCNNLGSTLAWKHCLERKDPAIRVIS